MRVIGAMVLLTFWCLGCSASPPEGVTDKAPTTTDAAKAELVDGGATNEVVVLPKRVRNVYEESSQSKRAWAKRMLLERRFPKEMCAVDSFLLNCVEAFRNPSTRVLGVFSKRECYESIEDIVGRALSVGGKRGGLTGDFYANDLPRELQAGAEMDIVAARLARRVLGILMPAMRKHGARFKVTPRCDALRSRLADVDGN